MFRRQGSPSNGLSAKMTVATSCEPSPALVIDLTLDDPSDNAISISTRRETTLGSARKRLGSDSILSDANKKAKSALASPAKVLFDLSSDTEIEIVTNIDSFQGIANTEMTSGDIVVVGTKNHTKLPHMRQHCTEKPFETRVLKETVERIANSNLSFCELCYCYVCDEKASECKLWHKHCHATDQGGMASRWRQHREKVRTLKAKGAWNPVALMAPLEGRGPFDPGNAQAAASKKFTACQYCGWYTDVRPRRYRIPDWCLHCGRVVSHIPKNVKQAPTCVPHPSEVSLGCKELPFTLHLHDPRKMNAFKRNWELNDTWDYDKKQMEKDFFSNQITNEPSLTHLLLLITPLAPHAIPHDGFIPRDNKICTYSISALECDAIVMDHSHIMLLEKLEQVSETIKFQIKATWDDAKSEGNVVIHASVSNKGIGRPDTSVNLSLFLGLWLGVFPCPFEELQGHVTHDMVPSGHESSLLPIHGRPNVHSQTESLISSGLNHSTNSALGHPSEILLTPTHAHTGGVSPTSYSCFKLFLKRYFMESLSDEVTKFGPRDSRTGGYKHGIRSYHRRALSGKVGQSSRSGNSEVLFGLSESIKYQLLCVESSNKPKKTLHQTVTSVATLLNHCENIGHAPAPDVDGLTVELLPFQKQSLQWAIERETMEGGVQSLHWGKVPLPSTSTEELYFNPALGMFSKTKPALVRGGMLCEEMGLGKTVLSLALFLSNPAPVTHLERSLKLGNALSSELGAGKEGEQGRILSAGTLVVCNISLVGQWIQEAKTKLRNPGLVYSYHGSDRKRDPKVLAKNSIVVTTYETLSSDLHFHARRNGSDYSPPMEQIRWWRIICDEAHVLRSSSIKVNAVMNLVADHKWLVSGTPISTSLKDLENQFKFLGLEKPAILTSMFVESVGPLIRDKAIQRFDPRPAVSLGKFTFFMRPLMMRHSQRMKYRGTQTTLMSLPGKKERLIKIDFAPNERAEYEKLEAAARAEYLSIERKLVNRSWMKISSSLLPLRIASAGGKIIRDVPLCGNGNASSLDGGDKVTEMFPTFSYESKLRFLVQKLRSIREKEPTSKSLVFSQFTATLGWLQQELPKHGFQFCMLSGDMPMPKRDKALRDFQADPKTTIFLLSIRSGAVGINLTSGNRIFLLDPCLNPVLEQQAIGRVWRLGQTRPVTIYRLIMKRSVEERMLEMLQKKYGSGRLSTQANPASDSGAPESFASLDFHGQHKANVANILVTEFDLLFGVEQSPTALSPSEYEPSLVRSR